MTIEHDNGWNAAIDAAEAIALKWRDENRTACIRARKAVSEASQMMADQLDGAAIECNAIAGAIRELRTKPKPPPKPEPSLLERPY